MISKSKQIKMFWSTEEDIQLKQIIEFNGVDKWTKVATKMPGRTAKQCRERWHSHLNNKIRKGDWQKEEDEIILKLQAKFGNHWASISELLDGRSDNDVKNRFYVLQRAITREENEKKSCIPNDNGIHYQTINTDNLRKLQLQHEIEKETECPPSKSRRGSYNSVAHSVSDVTEGEVGSSDDSICSEVPMPLSINTETKIHTLPFPSITSVFEIDDIEQELLDFLASGVNDITVNRQ